MVENVYIRFKVSYENLRMKYDVILEERRNFMMVLKRMGIVSVMSGGSGGLFCV